ncbi:hypothetical protein R3P38DRAFT_3058045 [Favolaschia claudopus]|uniref:F-box domain-containing protein n=1 Tax=Favolaschia claudopus TaxID=2862362 RepID=A0AAW0A3F9_9AGAR
MESIEDIHKRIAELSSAIDVQLDVLKALEERRSDARRTLNSRIDPMARLPAEISSEIFIRCTTDSPSLVFTEEPLKFLHICQLWREIAVSCPSLWASLQIKQVRPKSPDFNKACWDWFERARALPLSLCLHQGLHHSLRAWLKHFGRQIAHLELHVSDESQLYHVEAQGPFPELQRMEICYSNDLADCELDDSDDDAIFRFISSSVGMLLAAPSLVDCTFESMEYDVDADDLDSRTTHTCLRHLRLGTASAGHYSRNSAKILLGLTLPTLETLHLTNLDIIPEDLLSFFVESGSASSLQSLHMVISPFEGAEWSPLSPNLLDSCFRPLTALRTLELFHGLESDYIALLGVIRAKDFLPKLQHLLIHGPFGKPSNWKLVLDTIVARGEGTEGVLRSVQVISTIVWKETDLPLEVLTRLRELVREEGMSIYAGSRTTNFV